MTIEEAAQKFHWFGIGEDGVVELYLDHHSLSTFRMCEAAFELSMIASLKPKTKSWSLEFGIIFHKMVEEFYKTKETQSYSHEGWLSLAISLWSNANIDSQFSEHKMYKMLGGLPGFITMMAQYSEHFAKEVDRLRVIGIEVHFGKNKEVPLGEFIIQGLDRELEQKIVRCYLTGRIDFLMDSGNAIGPLDHKTTAFFKGNPSSSYDPQEGMTGYIYATQHILKSKFPELLGQRKVDRIWMNFAQIAPSKDANPLERFKRVPIFKTDWQLEQFRLRQLRTFYKIYNMIIQGQRADWNTSVCSNMFHTDCQYKNLHRQNTSSAMVQILNSDFNIAKEWNPETIDDYNNVLQKEAK